VATLSASIGELALAFDLPAGDRYLWDFATLPEWRGRGIYPRLLRTIIDQEGEDGRRFWIIHAPENAASGSGIAKAGFTIVSDLSFLRDGGVGVAAVVAERSRAGAALLGVPLFEAVLGGAIVSPCWRCVLAGQASGSGPAECWPRHDSSVSHHCSCVPAVAAG
jgi:hypothetical protein